MANPKFRENKIKRFIAKSFQPLIKLFSKKLYISLQYRYITGHKLHWDNLTRYTEKLQYMRLYEYPKNLDVINATSRVGARALVKEKGLEEILIPLIGVYTRVKDIDFVSLPNAFVIKASHASGLNIIVTNKQEMNIKLIKRKLNKFLKIDYGRKTVEPHYSKVKRELIIEEYVGTTSLPVEYKIHVFNGVPRYLYVVQNRGHNITYDNLYIDFTPFDGAQFNHWTKSNSLLEEPKEYKNLVEYARILGNHMKFCRIDFFLVNGKIYFNEFTFTPAKGTLIFDNDAADFEIGKWF